MKNLLLGICICFLLSGCYAAQIGLGVADIAAKSSKSSTSQSNKPQSNTIKPIRMNKEEAKNFVDRAANYCKSVGKEKALVDFNNSNGAFANYRLKVLSLQGITIGYNGPITGLLGTDCSNYKDDNGKYYYKEIISKCDAEGVNGYIDCEFYNPFTKKRGLVSYYFVRSQDVIILSSYNP